MAEGGYDPETTNPFDPHGDDHDDGDDDDQSPLIPRHRGGEEIEMRHRTLTPTTTSTSRQRWQHADKTTSFGGTPSGVMGKRIEAVNMLKEVYEGLDTTKIYTEIGRDGEVLVKLKGNRNKLYPILRNGEVLFTKDGKYIDDDGNEVKDKYGKEVIVPKTIRDALGKTKIEIMEEMRIDNEKDQERIKELDEKINYTAVGEERDKLLEDQNIVQGRINDRIEQIKTIEERLTLRQRIKEIFKKYGFTVIAVASAIATVIGVIVSNLKAGLTKVAKGVGNGLKELGKKLGEILPGMIGAIASFLFRTAGEVIGFLAKNAWLLVVGLVVLAVEQFKKKR